MFWNRVPLKLTSPLIFNVYVLRVLSSGSLPWNAEVAIATLWSSRISRAGVPSHVVPPFVVLLVISKQRSKPIWLPILKFLLEEEPRK